MDYDPKIEEALVSFREIVPRTWWNLYQGLMQQGFNESQSMVLVQTYILPTGGGGSTAPTISGPDHDKDAC